MIEVTFANRVAVVTGAGGGIGEAVARTLASADARVGVLDRDGEAAQRVASAINGVGVEIDIGDSQAVEQAVATVAEQLGTPTLLVNNAGTPGGMAPLRELGADTLNRALSVNINGTIAVTQAVVKRMAAAQTGGAIVNISSIGAEARPFSGMGHYEATKAAINALTRSAALEFAPLGIRVNAVAPGVVHTAMTRGLVENEQARTHMEARIPLGRVAEPEDIASMVVALLSDQARYMTGTVVSVDGGHLLT